MTGPNGKEEKEEDDPPPPSIIGASKVSASQQSIGKASGTKVSFGDIETSAVKQLQQVRYDATHAIYLSNRRLSPPFPFSEVIRALGREEEAAAF